MGGGHRQTDRDRQIRQREWDDRDRDRQTQREEVKTQEHMVLHMQPSKTCHSSIVNCLYTCCSCTSGCRCLLQHISGKLVKMSFSSRALTPVEKQRGTLQDNPDERHIVSFMATFLIPFFSYSHADESHISETFLFIFPCRWTPNQEPAIFYDHFCLTFKVFHCLKK